MYFPRISYLRTSSCVTDPPKCCPLWEVRFFALFSKKLRKVAQNASKRGSKVGPAGGLYQVLIQVLEFFFLKNFKNFQKLKITKFKTPGRKRTRVHVRSHPQKSIIFGRREGGGGGLGFSQHPPKTVRFAQKLAGGKYCDWTLSHSIMLNNQCRISAE